MVERILTPMCYRVGAGQEEKKRGIVGVPLELSRSSDRERHGDAPPATTQPAPARRAVRPPPDTTAAGAPTSRSPRTSTANLRSSPGGTASSQARSPRISTASSAPVASEEGSQAPTSCIRSPRTSTASFAGTNVAAGASTVAMSAGGASVGGVSAMAFAAAGASVGGVSAMAFSAAGGASVGGVSAAGTLPQQSIANAAGLAMAARLSPRRPMALGQVEQRAPPPPPPQPGNAGASPSGRRQQQRPMRASPWATKSPSLAVLAVEATQGRGGGGGGFDGGGRVSPALDHPGAPQQQPSPRLFEQVPPGLACGGLQRFKVPPMPCGPAAQAPAAPALIGQPQSAASSRQPSCARSDAGGSSAAQQPFGGQQPQKSYMQTPRLQGRAVMAPSADVLPSARERSVSCSLDRSHGNDAVPPAPFQLPQQQQQMPRVMPSPTLQHRAVQPVVPTASNEALPSPTLQHRAVQPVGPPASEALPSPALQHRAVQQMGPPAFDALPSPALQHRSVQMGAPPFEARSTGQSSPMMQHRPVQPGPPFEPLHGSLVSQHRPDQQLGEPFAKCTPTGSQEPSGQHDSARRRFLV